MGLSAAFKLGDHPPVAEGGSVSAAPDCTKCCHTSHSALLDKVEIFLDKIQNLISSGEIAPTIDANSISELIEHESSSEIDANCHLQMVQRVYQGRRDRNIFFKDILLFSEPGWDILLDLYISELMGKKISVTSSCIASCAPTTTALRWLAELEGQGLVSRELDPTDKRRIFVGLTDDGRSRMQAYVSHLIKPMGANLNRPTFSGAVPLRP
jgi:hypothetical protein